MWHDRPAYERIIFPTLYHPTRDHDDDDDDKYRFSTFCSAFQSLHLHCDEGRGSYIILVCSSVIAPVNVRHFVSDHGPKFGFHIPNNFHSAMPWTLVTKTAPFANNKSATCYSAIASLSVNSALCKEFLNWNPGNVQRPLKQTSRGSSTSACPL